MYQPYTPCLPTPLPFRRCPPCLPTPLPLVLHSLLLAYPVAPVLHSFTPACLPRCLCDITHSICKQTMKFTMWKLMHAVALLVCQQWIGDAVKRWSGTYEQQDVM